jgi:PAS domain S-box-containing protein
VHRRGHHRKKNGRKKALRESERDYRLLIDNIPNIVFKGYRNGTIDFFDDKIEVLTGYPKELFLNRTLKWTDLILDEDLQAERDRFIVAQRSDQQYIREYRIRRKDGKHRLASGQRPSGTRPRRRDRFHQRRLFKYHQAQAR